MGGSKFKFQCGPKKRKKPFADKKKKKKKCQKDRNNKCMGKKKPRNNITPSGGFGFRVNLEPPGAQGTVQQKKKSKKQVNLKLHK